jgi:hypothetical protein
MTNLVRAEELADGIYPIGGNVRHVKLSGGDWVGVGTMRTSTWERAEMRSVANDNLRFVIHLFNVDKAVEKGEPATVVLVVNDVALPFHSRVEHADGKLDLAFTIEGAGDVRKIADVLKVEPIPRKHPGHRVVLKLTPDKESYRPGEAVTLTVDICNVGDKAILFQMGGKQRGTRNNQFRFLCYCGAGSGKAVADTGNPWHHGGLCTMKPLAPGESVRETVALDKWFTFAEPDTYRVTGLYEMEMSEMPERFLRKTIWDELAVGECMIKVVAPVK